MTAGPFKNLTLLLAASAVALALALLWWLSQRPQQPAAPLAHFDQAAASTSTDPQPFRLALIPERDIFAQRRKHQALADYLARELHTPVQIVTLNTYEGVLLDFQQEKIDGAFLGSMVTVLAYDRLGAQVIAKPEYPGHISTYCGVIIVPVDSPIQSVDQLAGRSLAMVKTTTAGHIFPIDLLLANHLLDGPNPPQLRWVGTHDDVIRVVMQGQIEAGAVKNLRLNAFERSHENMIRRLAQSDEVPSNALVVRRDLPQDLTDRLRTILLEMENTDQGRAALADFGAERFLPCQIQQYQPIYDMADRLGPAWEKYELGSPAPASIDHPTYLSATDQ
jgi:phosphonate transport system substrate-binding protein